MCFYDNIVFTCGDWKWGHFRQHCQSEYRMGETCGMKFTFNTINDENKCTICIALDKKYRRHAKATSDHERWVGDPKRQALAEKAAKDIVEIQGEIDKLQADRIARYTNIGSGRQRNGNGANGRA